MDENIKKLGAIILKDRPTLKPITIKQYESQLKRIPKIFKTKNIQIIYDPDTVINKLDELENDPEVKHHFTSSRNLYNAIIVLLEALNANDDIIMKYVIVRDELNDRYATEQESGIISKKQQPNFATKKEVEEMIQKLKDIIEKINVKLVNKSYKLTTKDISILRSYTLFNMLIRIPTRNDASNMKFISQKQYKSLNLEEKKENNYLVNEKDNLKFIYNEYKTSAHYGEKIIPIGKELSRIMRSYIRIMNFEIGDNIFPMTRNAISQLLTKTSMKFTEPPKKISSTMIAKIYLSDKYGVTKDDMAADAKARGHSIKTQQSIYVKKNE